MENQTDRFPLYETVPHGVIVTDESGTIQFANTAFASLLVCQPETLMDKLLKDFISDCDTEYPWNETGTI